MGEHRAHRYVPSAHKSREITGLFFIILKSSFAYLDPLGQGTDPGPNPSIIKQK
jgi:hypothetical protein